MRNVANVAVLLLVMLAGLYGFDYVYGSGAGDVPFRAISGAEVLDSDEVGGGEVWKLLSDAILQLHQEGKLTSEQNRESYYALYYGMPLPDDVAAALPKGDITSLNEQYSAGTITLQEFRAAYYARLYKPTKESVLSMLGSPDSQGIYVNGDDLFTRGAASIMGLVYSSVSTIRYRYKDGAWQWTPYEPREDIWMPVTTTVVDSPGKEYHGRRPNWKNEDIITYLTYVNPRPLKSYAPTPTITATTTKSSPFPPLWTNEPTPTATPTPTPTQTATPAPTPTATQTPVQTPTPAPSSAFPPLWPSTTTPTTTPAATPTPTPTATQKVLFPPLWTTETTATPAPAAAQSETWELLEKAIYNLYLEGKLTYAQYKESSYALSYGMPLPDDVAAALPKGDDTSLEALYWSKEITINEFNAAHYAKIYTPTRPSVLSLLGSPDSEGIYEYEQNFIMSLLEQTDLLAGSNIIVGSVWYRYKDGAWQWTPYEPREDIWMPVTTTVVAEGWYHKSQPSRSNIEIINYLADANPKGESYTPTATATPTAAPTPVATPTSSAFPPLWPPTPTPTATPAATPAQAPVAVEEDPCKVVNGKVVCKSGNPQTNYDTLGDCKLYCQKTAAAAATPTPTPASATTTTPAPTSSDSPPKVIVTSNSPDNTFSADETVMITVKGTDDNDIRFVYLSGRYVDWSGRHDVRKDGMWTWCDSQPESPKRECSDTWTLLLPEGTHAYTAKAVDGKNQEAQASVEIKVNPVKVKQADAAPSPTQTPTPTPTPTSAEAPTQEGELCQVVNGEVICKSGNPKRDYGTQRSVCRSECQKAAAAQPTAAPATAPTPTPTPAATPAATPAQAPVAVEEDPCKVVNGKVVCKSGNPQTNYDTLGDCNLYCQKTAAAAAKQSPAPAAPVAASGAAGSGAATSLPAMGTFSASPAKIKKGGEASIVWKGVSASCWMSYKEAGATKSQAVKEAMKNMDGSIKIKPAETTTYTIKCNNIPPLSPVSYSQEVTVRVEEAGAGAEGASAFAQSCPQNAVVGFRTGNSYCDASGVLVAQKAANKNCDNSFECLSNVCAAGTCVESSVFKKFLEALLELT